MVRGWYIKVCVVCRVLRVHCSTRWTWWIAWNLRPIRWCQQYATWRLGLCLLQFGLTASAVWQWLSDDWNDAFQWNELYAMHTFSSFSDVSVVWAAELVGYFLALFFFLLLFLGFFWLQRLITSAVVPLQNTNRQLCRTDSLDWTEHIHYHFQFISPLFLVFGSMW